MHTKCAEFNVPISKLEYFQTVSPTWSYTEVLANITQPLTVQLSADTTVLNTIVSPYVYQQQWNVLTSVQRETTLENAYG
jgi:hypothetical protein